jgi:hypothetical protein
MTSKTLYYALDGNLSYDTLVKHFASQAQGRLKPVSMKNGNNGSHVIIFNQDKSAVNTSHNPRMELVDPSEAERRRTISALNNETELNNDTNHVTKQSKRSHRKRKTQSSKGKGVSDSAAQKIKKAKDVFDS